VWFLSDWGRKSFGPQSIMRTSCVPRALLQLYHLQTRTNLQERPGSELATPRGIPHTRTRAQMQRHHSTCNVWQFSMITYTWNAWPFVICVIRFGNNFNVKIDFLLQIFCLLWWKILLAFSCINSSFQKSTTNTKLYPDECPLMHRITFLSPKKSCTIIIVFILTKLIMKNWLRT
jgi:hypothetical protein